MSDDTQKPAGKDYIIGAMPNLPIIIHTQYVKDLSFENPHAPESLKSGQNEKPALDVNILLDAQKIEDEQLKALYEVSMTVRAESKRGGRTDFIAEITFGAAVSLNDVPEDKRHPLLFIEVPRLIFPAVRQAISQMTQAGGYAPLYLNPIDFMAMYVGRFGGQSGQVAGTA